MSSSILMLLAPAATGSSDPFTAFMTSGIVPLILMVLVFWFLILRPQMRQQKAHKAKIAAVKKGDQVLTGGGLLGKVIKVDDDYAEIELGPNMKVKALKSTIADVISPLTGKPAND